MNSAVYALSADPIHNGHVKNIQCAVESGSFDKVYVAVADSSKKKYLFEREERVKLARKALEPFKFENIIIESVDGLTAHYALNKGANYLIRGARNAQDFEYEKAFADFNQRYGLKTIIFPSSSDIALLSSSAVREIVIGGGLVHEYVHPAVAQALDEKVLGLQVVGVTGNMGAGKSTYCKSLVQKASELGINAYHFDADKVVHSLYSSQSPYYANIRKEMIEAFGKDVVKGSEINRKILAQIAFGNKSEAEKLKSILAVPFQVEFEKARKNHNGILLFDAAYLAEYNLESWVNYNVILVNYNYTKRVERVMKRDHIDILDFEVRASNQLSYEQIKEKITRLQSGVKHGFLHNVDSGKDQMEQELAILQEKFSEAKL